MPQHDLTLPSYGPEMIFPVASDDPREDQPDVNRIVSRWQDLASMDQQSPDFLPLLSSLTTGDHRSPTINLCGADARDTLSIMDEVSLIFSAKAITHIVPSVQVLRTGKIPSEHGRNTLHTMRKLAYNSGQVPPRYQVNRLSLSSEADVVASGSFADVRRGRLDNRAVAIRTLRVDQTTNSNQHQKVCVRSGWLSGNY